MKVYAKKLKRFCEISLLMKRIHKTYYGRFRFNYMKIVITETSRDLVLNQQNYLQL